MPFPVAGQTLYGIWTQGDEDSADFETRITQRGINVKDAPYKAKGDGAADDTAKINAAIIAMNALGGGPVFVPPGTYMVNADWLNGGSIKLLSNVALVLAKGATLKAITNAVQKYAVINGQNISNAGVYGGTILGERTTHTGIGGEWGMGIQLGQCTDVEVIGVTCKDCWGDGIYVGNYQDPITGVTTAATECLRVKIDRVRCDNNRRNGISIVGAIDSSLSGSDLLNTNGTAPQAGLDIEPNPGVSVVQNLTVDSCRATNNGVYGFAASAAADGVKWSNLTAKGNGTYQYFISPTVLRMQMMNLTAIGTVNTQYGIYFFTGGGVSASDHILIGFNCSGTYLIGVGMKGPGAPGSGRNYVSKVKCSGVFTYGIYLETQMDDNVFDDADVVGALGNGINCVLGDGNVFRNCRSRNGAQNGLRALGSRNRVEGGRYESNTLVGISLSNGTGCVVKGATARLNGGNGIEFATIDDGQIEGNDANTNSQTADLAGHNIRLSTAGNDTLIRGNTVRKGANANRPANGIFISVAGINRTQVLDNDTRQGGATREVMDSGTDSVIRNKPSVVTLAYSANMVPAPFDGQKQLITVTDLLAMTIAAPADNANALNFKGMRLTFEILNSSGGVMGAITWNAAFQLAGAFVNPANTKKRTITFASNGAKWVEESRAAADI